MIDACVALPGNELTHAPDPAIRTDEHSPQCIFAVTTAETGEYLVTSGNDGLRNPRALIHLAKGLTEFNLCVTEFSSMPFV
jgi:hypothetical protein